MRSRWNWTYLTALRAPSDLLSPPVESGRAESHHVIRHGKDDTNQSFAINDKVRESAEESKT